MLRKLKKDPFYFRVVNPAEHGKLPEQDRAVLNYAEKLTKNPGDMVKADVDRLRAAGFGDPAIHDICQITAYFNFVNRMAQGLGVPLEPGHETSFSWWGTAADRRGDKNR